MVDRHIKQAIRQVYPSPNQQIAVEAKIVLISLGLADICVNCGHFGETNTFCCGKEPKS